ncbi:TetR/AcrR family transcriptional regulator [Erwinia sorbitola]|uniref:TetR family transcriptional regulator n=1 Tax=Erwinia sorbitola TaxID=2681984 RepID=A0A6I6EME5_9GAMM|nr:TetR/AcrR family transcriptional regulator [Erwinia sorbitola]MTD25600.1 TetR family transcriptional regulator [Erwinia sorbitola]QGU87841.1 TetR family transcriptional regulator [Erwinia sorbitola]
MKETREVLRAKILEGAIALFMEKGIEKVTTRELTEHLGISRSHIYHYFRDWETLTKEAMGHYLLQDRTAFSATITGLNSAQRLTAFVANYLPATPDASWQIYSSLWQLAIHDTEWANMAEGMMDQWQTMLADIIREGVDAGEFTSPDPDLVARQLGAMLNGYADQLILSPTAATHQAATRDIGAFICMALRVS